MYLIELTWLSLGLSLGVWDTGLWEQICGVFCLFSIIDGFKWSWMGSFLKYTQLMLVFLKAPSLAKHFSYCTSMTFLMVLPVLNDDITSLCRWYYTLLQRDQASDLAVLAATWKHDDKSWRNRYVRLLTLYLQPALDPWLIVKI